MGKEDEPSKSTLQNRPSHLLFEVQDTNGNRNLPLQRNSNLHHLQWLPGSYIQSQYDNV